MGTPYSWQVGRIGPSAPSRLIQLMSGDSDLTSVGSGTPCVAAHSTLKKLDYACIHATDLWFEIYNSHCNSRKIEKGFAFIQCFRFINLGHFCTMVAQIF